MAKGDQITIATRLGDKVTVIARQNGRRVENSIEKEAGINWLIVREVTRGGTAVQTLKVAMDAVMSVMEERQE